MDKLIKRVKHWQSPVVGLLGLWFAVSPWVLGFVDEQRLMVVTLVQGLALVATAAVMLHDKHAASGAWGTAVLGVVAAVSPWLLGHGEDLRVAANAVLTGVVSALLGFMVGLKAADPDTWWNDRVAH